MAKCSTYFGKKYKHGFSLIELSIVLVVIGILLVSSLSLGGATIDAARISQTKTKIAKLQEALLLYYQLNGSLPCPADGTLAVSGGNFGVSSKTNGTADSTASNASCTTSEYAGAAPLNGSDTVYIGSIPTRTLKISDDYGFDAWGNRITFAVAKDCVDPDNWSNANTYICKAFGGTGTAGGNITVQDNTGSSVRLTNAIYVIVSHGKNGIGAWRRAGGATRVASTASTSTYETENAHVNTSGATVSYDKEFTDDVINDGSTAANYFDDVVAWIDGNQFYYDAYN